MFKDRKEAGQLLAEKLLPFRQKKDTILLGIPRGGVVLAYEMKHQLELPLDVVVIKKIGFPGNQEFAIGATGLDSYFINEKTVEDHHISEEYIQEQVKTKQREVKQRYEFLRGDKPPYSLKDKTAIVVDDGLATGATMIMAVQIINKESPQKVVVAVPVAPADTVRKMEKVADKVICLLQPPYFRAIGQFYQDFRQVEDEEAKRLLG